MPMRRTAAPVYSFRFPVPVQSLRNQQKHWDCAIAGPATQNDRCTGLGAEGATDNRSAPIRPIDRQLDAAAGLFRAEINDVAAAEGNLCMAVAGERGRAFAD